MKREQLALLGVAVLLCAAVLGFAGRHLETPGLYYDEVIQATPASEFLREGGRPSQVSVLCPCVCPSVRAFFSGFFLIEARHLHSFCCRQALWGWNPLVAR